MSAARDTWHRPPFIANPVLRWALYLGVGVYVVWVIATLPVDWNRVSEGVTRAGRIFGGAFPPSFERSGLLVDGFLESLRIAVLATAVGVLVSIPIAFMVAGQKACPLGAPMRSNRRTRRTMVALPVIHSIRRITKARIGASKELA